MLQDILLLLAGGLGLYFGAEWLVSGASSLALALRVPKLLVGLTVVAYGTSAPEVIVGVQAALAGHGAVAFGNVVGSNIANLGLILGLTTLVQPARVDPEIPRRQLPVLVTTALALPLLSFDAAVSRFEGAILVVAAVVLTGTMVRSARARMAEAEQSAQATAEAAKAAGAPEPKRRATAAAIALVGLIVLLVGGDLFVRGAAGLARALGMSERVVGLTVVAVGTSLPELATSVIAAVKGHSDIAVGNVVGSNVFNVLLCLGGAALARPVEGVDEFALDVGAMVALTAVGAVFMRRDRIITRTEGAVLLAAYAAFLGRVVLAT